MLRTFFYFLIRERNLRIDNPCAKFKHLKDPRAKAKRRPPTYRQEEIDRIFAQCDAAEKAAFATLLLTGLRDEELCFLTWADVDLANADDATVRVSGEGKPGFSPKDYEERVLPIPSELAALLGKLPRNATWVFPTSTGNRQTHLLRRLKEIAEAAKVANATLHKFRHTYATRLLESGCDIVTVQKLMGHSDIETTRQYLDPDEKLKRKAVNKLSLKGQLITCRARHKSICSSAPVGRSPEYGWHGRVDGVGSDAAPSVRHAGCQCRDKKPALLRDHSGFERTDASLKTHGFFLLFWLGGHKQFYPRPFWQRSLERNH